MRNLTKIFRVIIVVALWLSGSAAFALADTEVLLENAGDPLGRVVIICNESPQPNTTCDFGKAKFCNANLCKPGSSSRNPVPAEARLWKYQVFNGLEEPIFLEQTQNKSCHLNFPKSNEIQAKQLTFIEYECNPSIQYLANYITMKKGGAPVLVDEVGKVTFTNLTCVDNTKSVSPQ
ncbi:MAG: hypothetical protein F6K16_19360 [Symploca sp. SIO2B6]|nr:hypothetical protein [Symploca sp. SIO2B6]